MYIQIWPLGGASGLHMSFLVEKQSRCKCFYIRYIYDIFSYGNSLFKRKCYLGVHASVLSRWTCVNQLCTSLDYRAYYSSFMCTVAELFPSIACVSPGLICIQVTIFILWVDCIYKSTEICSYTWPLAQTKFTMLPPLHTSGYCIWFLVRFKLVIDLVIACPQLTAVSFNCTHI